VKEGLLVYSSQKILGFRSGVNVLGKEKILYNLGFWQCEFFLLFYYSYVHTRLGLFVNIVKWMDCRLILKVEREL
jgi:hypothetical protein